MSLNVSLYSEMPVQHSGTGVFIRTAGGNKELTVEEVKEKFPDYDVQITTYEDNYVFEANITHNLNRMAKAAGIYRACWRPETIEITKAKDLIPILESGLTKLKGDPEYYKQFDAVNGWGTHKDFVPWVKAYLNACKQYPEATIEVSR